MRIRRSVPFAALVVLVALAPARAHVVQHCPEADNCSRQSPCDDGDPCTRDYCEVTESGEGCCEHEAISPCLDAFLCYDTAPAAKAPEVPSLPTVRLVDQLEDRRFRVNGARALCNPANRGAGTHDAATRLRRYPVAPVAPGAGVVARAIKVRTDLGTTRVDVERSDALLVPAAVDLLAPPATRPARFDRFSCHDVRSTKDAARTRRGVRLKLSDHFTGEGKTFEVLGAERLCTAVDVDGAGVVDACGAFLCYGVRPAADEPAFAPLRELWVRDAFALQQVDALVESEVCLPATVDGRTCLPQGYACAADVQCTTNHCVDGVCCETACDAPCHACLGSLTGRPHGICAPAAGDLQCPSAGTAGDR